MTALGFDLAAFLAERQRPASVATVTTSGSPALATMWFCFEHDRFWFHSPPTSRAFLDAAAQGRDVAVMVATWSPPHDVRQVRATGPARLESYEPERVVRIYERYLDGEPSSWGAEWSLQIASLEYQLWSLYAARGMVVSYLNLEDGPLIRWSHPREVFE